jgi:hypothetical protein
LGGLWEGFSYLNKLGLIAHYSAAIYLSNDTTGDQQCVHAYGLFRDGHQTVIMGNKPDSHAPGLRVSDAVLNRLLR